MPSARTRLKRARGMADLLDSAYELPLVGTRVGLDAIVGLVPVLGDWLTMCCSLYIVYEALRAGVPKPTLLRMLLTIGVDAVFGAVPVLGDILDVVWKANQRNVRLFERHLNA